MTRRIVRTSSQLGFLVLLLVFLVYLLDTRYRVLPSAIHTHLPAHHPGLVVTDITVKTCSFSSCKLDPAVWHRIEKDLFLKSGWITKSYVHIQRKKEEDLKPEDKVVMDVKVGRLDPGKQDGAENGELWEKRPAGLWIKRSGKRQDSDSKDVVTAVDVLFGADAVEPRPGWSIREQALLLDYPRDAPEARITIRRGSPKKIDTPVPRVRKDGKFKIMQLADLHLSTGLGTCRDAVPPSPDGKCEADPRTLSFVERLLDQEKPDFVVLSGDQVNGETAPDAQSAIFKFVDILASRKIPYAAIYGNHDDEGSLSRQATADLLQTLPYSMTQSGPNTIPGVGNYYIRVLSHTGHHAALTMFFLDTHSYSPDEHKYKGYDWIKPEQIQWFKAAAESLKADNKKYSHIHLDMAFIHIPLPEYRDGGVLVGERREPPTSPGYNSGFRDALVEMGVPVVSCGHDHANDYCLLSEKQGQFDLPERRKRAPPPAAEDSFPPGDANKDAETGDSTDAPVQENKPTPAQRKKDDKIWLCYGGGVGFGGYGGWNGYIRRVRFFELDANEAKIRTWKRVEYGDVASRIDEQVIVDAGKVVRN
ncbi:uncharacterized protein PV09_06139 [Verruconis gallopava]|uniref:Calcineurin-like phosphoesterase domain-containing protein n=1 Tax=Verruconis gallopava TaxID=253628 RepID=A0A0D1XK40_9PEZI|nr:uncharacterized protein PV09_06139 [Verruconis gallopava]KIW02701.1 hypothetical protein PV09_06139 [Verruconis gallopava]